MNVQVLVAHVFVQELFGPFICEKEGSIGGESSEKCDSNASVKCSQPVGGIDMPTGCPERFPGLWSIFCLNEGLDHINWIHGCPC